MVMRGCRRTLLVPHRPGGRPTLDETARAERASRALGFCLGLLASLALIGTARAENCRLVRQWSFDFIDGPSGAMLTRQPLATGHGYFVFDSGAVANVIFADQADALHLQRGRGSHTIVGAGGMATDVAVVDPFSLREYFVVPRVPGGDPREAGALGAPLYLEHDLELDFRDRKIGLYLPDHCSAASVYRAPEFTTLPLQVDRFGRAFVTVTLDGAPLAALIDTGATDTTLSLDAARRRFGLVPGSPGVEPAGTVRDVQGNVLVNYRRPFKALQVGGIRFDNPRIDISGTAWEPGTDLILGMNELRRLHLFFAFREQLLYAARLAPVAVAAKPIAPSGGPHPGK
jgi:predicted aspartyl protease